MAGDSGWVFILAGILLPLMPPSILSPARIVTALVAVCLLAVLAWLASKRDTPILHRVLLSLCAAALLVPVYLH